MTRALFPIPFLMLASLGDAQTVVFSEDFESGATRWSTEHLWHVATEANACLSPAGPFSDGSSAMWFGDDATCDYDHEPYSGSALELLAPVALPVAPALRLRLSTWSDTEGELLYDRREVRVSTDGGAAWTELGIAIDSDWIVRTFDLTSYAGESVLLQFRFTAVDDGINHHLGWLVDDIEIVADASPGVVFCDGADGQVTCPCQNQGAPGRGCGSSFEPLGARLVASGVPSVSADTLALHTVDTSASWVTYIQGLGTVDAYRSDGPFGDGVLCIGFFVTRIGSVFAAGGACQMPPGGSPISVRGAIPAGGGVTRSYQAWYRNSAPFCTPERFNLSNAVQIVWGP